MLERMPSPLPIKRLSIPTGQSKMDNPKKLAKHRVHKTKTNKAKQAQHNMRWTPLYASKH